MPKFEPINRILIRTFFALFFGFVLITTIMPFVPEKYHQIEALIFSLVTFAFGCYLLKEIFKLRKDVELFKITDESINLSILISVTYCLFFTSTFFLLLALNASSNILMLALIIPNFGFAFALIAIILYKEGRRKVKLKLGFNKQRLPVTIIDFILAGLMLLLACLVSPLKILLLLVGLLFFSVAILSLIVKY